ncbi:phosphatase PAP2 family protein [Arthrobacter sp. B2a2-09]|uniref:phosphatase PAP2 family protein n=1 Tax=Arthrobacter sp. B2a2-09 TaxID=2952822 RepID=UPI0022CD66BF|nr:phosphatase PAP2 family protein [Arthrobacter sp. B2a2-09]MCZ9881796.1 phosphatase PAP2 family protein [Arthrobacter sp. B2a2-09]
MVRVILPRKLDQGRTMVISTVLLAVAVLLGGILLEGDRNPPFQGLDDAWYGFAATLHSPFWDGVNLVLNWTGYTGMLIFHILLASALLFRRRPLSAAFSAVAGLTVMLLTQLLKWIIHRPRPLNAHVATDTYSYPSGHVSATTAFVLVVALLIGRGWAWLLAIGGMLAMMISRIYLAAHWLTDVVGGACLASGVVLLLWLASQKICIEENIDARRALDWKSRVARRKRHAGQGVT